jgi:tight adherence protein C
MSPQFSIPIALAFVAFFIADIENHFLSQLFRRTLKIGNRTQIETRLAKLGRTQLEDYENFRISQLAYVSIFFLLMSFALIIGLVNLITYLISLPFITFGVFVSTERNLKKRCEKRVREIESEFPTVIEMLTLAVGAGESPASALKRISLRASGLVADEFKRVIAELEDGRSLTAALDDLSQRLSSDPIRRFVDSFAISISRGSSLVETLSHGAYESRNQERVRLLAAAGKSEITMMIPVVFLILPVSILFALYPSLTNLNLFGGG